MPLTQPVILRFRSELALIVTRKSPIYKVPVFFLFIFLEVDMLEESALMDFIIRQEKRDEPKSAS